VVDRDDRILRILPDARGDFRIWIPVHRAPSYVKAAVTAAEDRRFFHHPGFDPLAVVRALYTNVTRGRIVSGASTITQQVVRLIRPRPRTYRAKIVELLESLKMELQLSKQEILELYLNLSPMGGNIRGIGLAARIYFDKEIERVNPAEAAALAAMPRSPSRFDPRRKQGREAILAGKDRILRRMARSGAVEPGDLDVLLGSSVDFKRNPFPLEAPHFTDMVIKSGALAGPVIRTTLDLDLQRRLEHIVHSHRDRLAGKGIRQAGAMVVSVRTAEILGMVGSMGYRARDGGYNNATMAPRGAGSTLKPFLYALAVERGHNAFSEIPDTFRSYRSPRGDYLPLNADRMTYGPVTVRSALGNSLNISAVKIAGAMGLDEFYGVLTRLAIVGDRTPPPDHYGLGLAIGNMEASLYSLVQSYGCLAGRGLHRTLTAVQGKSSRPVRVFSAETAYVISHILADPAARLLTFGNPEYLDFGFPVSVKTGTSSNYRDCWIIGYTPRHVIGVWAGNFDGRPNTGVTGATACGPILKDIVGHLYRSGGPGKFPRPESVVEVPICWISGRPASRNCPYATKELFIGDPASIVRCRRPHGSDGFRYLGAPYSRWVHRRETEQGRGRFRLHPLGTYGRPSSLAAVPRHDAATIVSHDVGPLIRTSRISIANPHNLDHFVISSHEEDRIRFRAIAHPVCPYLTWFMDGMEIARTPPPYEFFWKPVRGRHVIHVVNPENQGAGITIHVE